MERAIVGFHQDDEQHWVAELSCGHDQHVRHDPPLSDRPWVLTPEGREGRKGDRLDCLRCDRFEPPPELVAYRRTPEFDEHTLPDALRRRHDTKAGVWAEIHVLEGRVHYRVFEPVDRVLQLEPDRPGLVLPEVPHALDVTGPVRLYVEFARRERGAGGDPLPSSER